MAEKQGETRVCFIVKNLQGTVFGIFDRAMPATAVTVDALPGIFTILYKWKLQYTKSLTGTSIPSISNRNSPCDPLNYNHLLSLAG